MGTNSVASTSLDVDEKKDGSSAPDEEEKADIQLEPTQEEMERERLTSKAEQVSSVHLPLFGSVILVTLPFSASRRDTTAPSETP